MPSLGGFPLLGLVCGVARLLCESPLEKNSISMERVRFGSEGKRLPWPPASLLPGACRSNPLGVHRAVWLPPEGVSDPSCSACAALPDPETELQDLQPAPGGHQ